jgi:hypothetical protein
MENEVTDDVLLHYTMLEFLFSMKKLASSCNNHCWEEFRAKHPQYLEHSPGLFVLKEGLLNLHAVPSDFLLHTVELKTIFWSEVMPSIETYELMKPEMREYFETNKMFTEDAFESIAAGKYEPKRNIDFKTFSSLAALQANAGTDFNLLHEMFKDTLTEPRTYAGSFGLDLDQGDRNCLNICTTAPQAPIESDDVDLIETFSEALRVKDEEGVLTQGEILNRLANPNIISKMDHFKKLPGGVQKYMEQFPFFKELLRNANREPDIASPPSSVAEVPTFSSECSSDKENTTRNSMNVPNLSLTPLSEGSNRSLRPLPSRSSDVQALRELLEEETPKSRRNEPTQEKVVNRRMAAFTKNFTHQKRRRGSSSPTEGQLQ